MADHIEVGSDSDSGYVTSEASTSSVTSSVYAYEHEHGRSYHAYNAGKYHVPNDEGEQERMDIHYHALRLVLNNKLYLAPLESPTSILDVGTGTGIWAIDAADSYPGSTILGIDLSPIQPTSTPPNCTFQVFDLETDEWDMPSRFDMVHTRLMNGTSIRNWPKFFAETHQSLRPGGWFEAQEIDAIFASDDDSLPADCAMQRWVKLWNEGAERGGIVARFDADKVAGQMKEAGFVNVNVVALKMPVGTWPKDKRLRESGMFAVHGMMEGLKGLSLKIFLNLLGWGAEELEVLLAQVRADFKRKDIHAYFPVYVVYGQKPAQAAGNSAVEAETS